MTDIKEEVWTLFKDFQHVFLATVEDDQPRVRPVTLIYFDKKFWITTGTEDAKIKQIQKNPKIELCLYLQEGDKECYVRVAGMAKIIKDRETKETIARHCDFFSKHWEDVDDPNYTLIEIRPIEVEYLGPGEFLAQRFKL
ncbi:MAG: pyridoxamine 5'-phosphate oxidase family protein [Methanomicrobia archaeon]|nr:pyridoxamine 5'-phosphate oxidase family protein [Methanomicrobia archaeon]